MAFQYTLEQENALNYVKTFINSPIDKADLNSYLCTLAGYAGTGKTTLTKEVVKLVRKSGKQVLCVAPTHKARKVLSSIINTSSFLRIPTSTIAGLLGKIRAHGYVGTQNYARGLDSKIGMYDFFIVDEISMVTTDDYREICKLALEYQKKIFYIGDHLQIPNPSQKYSQGTDPDGTVYLQKHINPAFSEPYQLRLTEIVRTGSDNPLLDLLSKVRDNVGKGFLIKDMVPASETTSQPTANGGYLLIEDQSAFNLLVQNNADLFKTNKARVVCYTNHTVHQYNKLIRTALKYTESVVQGEILMGYNNVGPNQDPIIENGQDYIVTSIKETEEADVSANGKNYDNLSGKILTMAEIQTKSEVKILILSLTDAVNNEILEDLVTLADKVNRKGSTKRDYRNYMALKSQLVFMEHLYKYNNGIYTGKEFKQIHPLLFTKTTEAIHDPGKLDSLYPCLLKERLADNKEISHNELLADMYQILEKDIDYGYAITSHKSQGSTYETVFIDEPDFLALRDGWSSAKKLTIRRSMERDQLKYVALSRPSMNAYILLAHTLGS